jgi:DNA-binding GntR family transcriptional regulator
MKNESTTLSAQIHDSILEKIISAGAAADSMLLTESALVKEYGVSKAPVREALLRLCAEEVLTSIPRCGYVVVRLGEKSGKDNMIVRSMLEISSLEHYFGMFTPEKIDHIAENLKRARDICAEDKSIWTLWQQNITFHTDLIMISDNPYLVKSVTNCIEVERRFFAQNHFGAKRDFNTIFYPEAHEKILDAIRRGDKEDAINRLRKDIGYNMDV